jgi:hypothetical protein
MTTATPTARKQCYRVPVQETRIYTIRVRAYGPEDASDRVEDGPEAWEEILPGERILFRQATERPEAEVDYDEAAAGV